MKLTWQGPARQDDLQKLGFSISEEVSHSVAGAYSSTPELTPSSFLSPLTQSFASLGAKSDSEAAVRGRSYTSLSYLRELLPSVFATSHIGTVAMLPNQSSFAGAYRVFANPASLLVTSLLVEYVYGSSPSNGQFAQVSSLPLVEQGVASAAASGPVDYNVNFFELNAPVALERFVVSAPEFSIQSSKVAAEPSAAVAPLLEEIAEFAQQVGEALEESYVTLVQQAKEYVSIGEDYVNIFAGDLRDFTSPAFDAIYSLPEGPRTPLLRVNEYGFAVGGDDNSAEFGFLSELNLSGSVTRRGDPSEPSPDDNDLPGQLELEIFGLNLGANFQNGAYLGEYRQETEEVEAHRHFQTGMIDQSGTYINDQRVEATDIAALNPEAAGKYGLFDLVGSDLSVEAIGEFLYRASNANERKSGIEEDSAAVDREMAENSYESVSLFESADLEMDASFLGAFVDSMSADSQESDGLETISSPISASYSEMEEFSSIAGFSA